MVAVHWGIGPEEVCVAEYLLEGAYGLGALCREPLSHMGEEPEAALVLTIEVYLCVTPLFGSYQLSTVGFEVFLKAATFPLSFFTWLFLAVFTDAPKLRFT